MGPFSSLCRRSKNLYACLLLLVSKKISMHESEIKTEIICGVDHGDLISYIFGHASIMLERALVVCCNKLSIHVAVLKDTSPEILSLDIYFNDN